MDIVLFYDKYRANAKEAKAYRGLLYKLFFHSFGFNIIINFYFSMIKLIGFFVAALLLDSLLHLLDYLFLQYLVIH
jgi:hypothetical protein